MKIDKKTLVTALTFLLIGIVGTSIIWVYASPSAGTFYISEGIYPQASYTIWKEGSTHYAKDAFGQIDYSGSSFTTVTNNAINALTNGGKILFREGLYEIDGQITISNNMITLEGSGWGTRITTTSATGNIINAISKWDIAIKNMRITSEVNKTSGAGIYLNDVDRCDIDFLRIQKQYFAIYMANCTMVFVEDCYIYQTVSSVIYIDGGNDQYLTRIVSDNSGGYRPHGIYVKETAGLWITDVDIIHSANGIYLNPTTGKDARNIFASNFAVDECSENGAYFKLASGGSIMRITFNNFWSASNDNYGFVMEGGTDIRINLAKIRGNTNNGFHMINGTNVWLTNSDVRDNAIDVNIVDGDFHWAGVKTDAGFSEKSSYATVTTGTAITHGLAGTPTTVILTMTVSEDVWVTSVGATQFTINFDGGGSQTVYWYAQYQP